MALAQKEKAKKQKMLSRIREGSISFPLKKAGRKTKQFFNHWYGLASSMMACLELRNGL